MGKIGLIIGREYLSRVSKKSFIIMTILGPLLIGGFITLMIYLSMEEEKKMKVWVVDLSGLMEGRLENTDKVEFFYDKTKIDKGQDEEKFKEEFKESDYDLMLYIKNDPYKHGPPLLYYKKLLNFASEKSIMLQLQKTFEDYKISTIENFDRNSYEEIRNPITIVKRDVNQESNIKRERGYVGYFFTFLIYLFVLMYGVQVMRGVMEEKSSRIIEVLVSSVKPFQLMMGKIIGIALVGLTQFVIWALLTFSILYISKAALFDDKYEPSQIEANADATKKQEAPQEQTLNQVFNLIYYGINYTFMIALFLFYFIFGYLMYAALFAAIGSAVDSETDTQQFMLPITIPLIFGWTMLPAVISDPESSNSFWMSIFPLTSPVVMMVRGSMGFEPGTVWQLFLSMGLLIAAFIGATWIAGKIYRTGILMYGKKVTYKELWKWLRY